ncbi:MAG: hypothetical protein MK179_12255 [Pirellulaceae bacterium]|nr:hypothetical protein [Pirellulaceae bacterium]
MDRLKGKRFQHQVVFRTLCVELLEPRVVLSAQSWYLGPDFAADFVGGLPVNNPNGVWAYLGTDGTTSSLEKTNGNGTSPGPNTFGVGAGWADATGVPSFARGGAFGLPAQSLAGHGPNRIIWTAPTEANLGGIKITGTFQQVDFEPTRQMQLSVFKNSFPLFSVDATTTTTPIPVTRVAIQPGDTLDIVVNGNGPQGNGINTFAATQLTIQEIDPQIDADFNGDLQVDEDDYVIWETNLGMTSNATQQHGDADGDADVDGKDGLLWGRQFGNSIDSGSGTSTYHPAAIIVNPSGVTLPDGSALDISDTQTDGLQEAFDHSAAQGWDVFVLPGTYTLDAHLDIEEIQLRTFRIKDATFNFTSSVTDFGIRFDSTMLTDLYWSGGGINAPHATHGVVFKPRTPHPLDGQLYGTIGAVDSRFHFNVNITAKVYPVTMNSLQATINDLSLHFDNVLPQNIHYVGNGFWDGNIFPVRRTDDPIPFDLLSTAGRVTVVPPLSDISAGVPGTVYLPDGSQLDVSGTDTFGLQEAFTYAGTNDLDVVVFGRGVRNVSPSSNLGLYNLNAPLVVSDLTNRAYRIYGVTFNYPNNVGDALSLGDVVNSHFELTGQVVASQASNGVSIRPDNTGISNSRVSFQAVIGSNSFGHVGVLLDANARSIQGNELIFHEVNTGYFGIKILNPSITTQFSNNTVRSLHTHNAGHIGIQVGESFTNAGNIHSNTVEVRTNTDGNSSETALQVWGHSNTFDLFALNSGLKFGAKFEPGSNGNTMYYGTLQANTQITNFGTNNLFIPHLMASFTNMASDDTASGAPLGWNPSGSSSDEDFKQPAISDLESAELVEVTDFVESVDRPNVLSSPEDYSLTMFRTVKGSHAEAAIIDSLFARWGGEVWD